MSRPPLPTRICVTCGRSFQWRRKWARDWESVRHCSKGCRRHPVGDRDLAVEETVMEMLRNRTPSSSICPSEVARRLDPENWKAHLETVRRAVRRLVARQRVLMIQSGRVVDPDRARGPIRVRLVDA